MAGTAVPAKGVMRPYQENPFSKKWFLIDFRKTYRIRCVLVGSPSTVKRYEESQLVLFFISSLTPNFTLGAISYTSMIFIYSV